MKRRLFTLLLALVLLASGKAEGDNCMPCTTDTNCPVTLFETAAELKLFGPNDPYRYDVDNRPLLMLLENDKFLRDCLNSLYNEVADARDTFPCLDDRLDSLASSPLFNVTAGPSARAELLRKQYHWGVVDTAPASSTDLSSPFSLETKGQDLISNFDDATWPKSIVGNMTEVNEIWMHGSNWMVDGYEFLLTGSEVGGASTPSTVTGGGFIDENRIKLSVGPTTVGRYDLVFLEVWREEIDSSSPVFWKYGNRDYHDVAPTTTDPTDATVAKTIDFLTTGNYSQIQYRIRVLDDVSWDTDLWTIMTGQFDIGGTPTDIEAQGPNASPTAASTFDYFENHGPGVNQGLTSEMSASSVPNCVGGVVYAVPLAVIARRNLSSWNKDTQNGSSVDVGGAGTPDILNAATRPARPDFKYGDRIYTDEIIDLRPHLMLSMDFDAMMDLNFKNVLAGHLDTNLVEAAYSHQDNGSFTYPGTVGTHPLWVDFIDDAPVQHTNTVRDWKLTGTPAPQAFPDDVRRVWAGDDYLHLAEFTIPNVAVDGALPASYADYDKDVGGALDGGVTLSVTSLSGYAASGPSSVIANVQPVMLWPDGTAVSVSPSPWTALGTATASATIDRTSHDGEEIKGYAWIQYEAGSGYRYKLRKAWHQKLVAPIGTYETKFFGRPFLDFGIGAGAVSTHLTSPRKPAVDANQNVYIPDAGEHVVVKLTAGMAYTTSIGTYATPLATDGNFNVPVAVGADATNIYVCDSVNDRIQKFDIATLTHQANFTTGDPTLDNPQDIDVDGSGNMYIIDSGNDKVIKLDSGGSLDGTSFDLTGNQNAGRGGCALRHDFTYVAVTDNDSTNGGMIRFIRSSDLGGAGDASFDFGGNGLPDSAEDFTKLGLLISLDWDRDGYLIAHETTSILYPGGRVLRIQVVDDGTDVTEAHVVGKWGDDSQETGSRWDHAYLQDSAQLVNHYGCTVGRSGDAADDYKYVVSHEASNNRGTATMSHQAMAVLSQAERRIETLMPMLSTWSLELWYTGAGYQGLAGTERDATTFDFTDLSFLRDTNTYYISTLGQGSSYLQSSDLANSAPIAPLWRDLSGVLPIGDRNWMYDVNEDSIPWSGGGVEVTATQAETYATSTGPADTLELTAIGRDGLEVPGSPFTITLTSGAAETAATMVADINGTSGLNAVGVYAALANTGDRPKILIKEGQEAIAFKFRPPASQSAATELGFTEGTDDAVVGTPAYPASGSYHIGSTHRCELVPLHNLSYPRRGFGEFADSFAFTATDQWSSWLEGDREQGNEIPARLAGVPDWFVDLPDSPKEIPRYLIKPFLMWHQRYGVILLIQNYLATGPTNAATTSKTLSTGYQDYYLPRFHPRPPRTLNHSTQVRQMGANSSSGAAWLGY